jgi:hypothetical protein
MATHHEDGQQLTRRPDSDTRHEEAGFYGGIETLS